MSRRLIFLLFALFLGACATSGGEAPLSKGMLEGDVASSSPTSNVPDITTNKSAGGASDQGGSRNDTTDEVIKVARVPKVPTADLGSLETDAALNNQLICRREMRTGSHRPTRVCRTRAEIEKSELDGKETFKELHRSQGEYSQ